MSKFETEIDEAIYQLTLDGGVEDEFGSVTEGSAHYSRITVPAPEDVDNVTVPAGLYIVVENDLGFVTVLKYDLTEDDDEARCWYTLKNEYEGLDA